MVRFVEQIAEQSFRVAAAERDPQELVEQTEANGQW
jgi:hypothetical protein